MSTRSTAKTTMVNYGYFILFNSKYYCIYTGQPDQWPSISLYLSIVPVYYHTVANHLKESIPFHRCWKPRKNRRMTWGVFRNGTYLSDLCLFTQLTCFCSLLALHLAVQQGHINSARVLLTESSVDIGAENDRCESLSERIGGWKQDFYHYNLKSRK